MSDNLHPDAWSPRPGTTWAGPAGRAFPLDLSGVRPATPAVTAAVGLEDGLPVLRIDGRRRDPLFFFGNTEWRGHEAHVFEEIRMAAARGIHLHTLVLHFPVVPEGTPRDLSPAFAILDRVLEADPEALILPRIPLYPKDRGAFAARWPDDCMRYADGTRSIPSVASDRWMAMALAALDEGIGTLADHPVYSRHIIGYHLSYNNTGEWFYEDYRERGIDRSECNRQGFARWLREVYGTDRALRSAWGRPEVSLDEIALPGEPNPLPGSPDVRVPLPPERRDVLDLYRYLNDINELRIEQLARFAKCRTGGRSLVMIFYGYTMELPDPRSGHCNLDELLACGDVDLLASPVSYQDRAEGGVMAFMAPVDSIQAHGVLWMVEDDTRTFRALDQSELDAHFNPTIRGVADTREVHRRNMAAVIARSCGLWWMDLWGSGWLRDDGIWDGLADLRALYRARMGRPFRPRVAILSDEKSCLHLNNAFRHAVDLLYRANVPIYRCGFSMGLYTLRDAAEGRLPDSVRLAVVLDALDLPDDRRTGLRTHCLDRGVSLLFQYACGLVQPTPEPEDPLDLPLLALESPAPARFQLERDGSWIGRDTPVFPRFHVREDPDITVLGRYADGLAAFAERSVGTAGARVLFCGAMGSDPAVLRLAARRCGVPIHLEEGDALYAGEGFLAFHASEGGHRVVRLPGWHRVTDECGTPIPVHWPDGPPLPDRPAEGTPVGETPVAAIQLAVPAHSTRFLLRDDPETNEGAQGIGETGTRESITQEERAPWNRA